MFVKDSVRMYQKEKAALKAELQENLKKLTQAIGREDFLRCERYFLEIEQNIQDLDEIQFHLDLAVSN